MKALQGCLVGLLVLAGLHGRASGQGSAPPPPQAPTGAIAGKKVEEPSPVEKLAATNKDLAPALVESLNDADPGVREMAASTLTALGKAAIPALTAGLKSDDSIIRANSAYLLGQVAPAQDVMPPLLKAMKDDDKDVRRRAAYSVHRLVMSSTGSGVSGSPDPGLMLPPTPTLEKVKNWFTPMPRVTPVYRNVVTGKPYSSAPAPQPAVVAPPPAPAARH